jgi:hypothetical protein
MLQAIGANDTRCTVKRKSAAKVILSYDVEKVPAAGMGISSLRRSRL